MVWSPQIIQKVPVFKLYEKYRLWSRYNLFPDPVFTENKMISNQIDWVLENKCPIYYWPKNNAERLIYTGCYNIMPIVHPSGPFLGEDGRYENPIICGLTHSHEFAHEMFVYPRSLRDMTEDGFNELMQNAEAAASNFSELVIYCLSQELVELTKDFFFRPGWYDRLAELGYKMDYNDPDMPELDLMHQWRRYWIAHPEKYEELFAPLPKYKGLRAYMNRFAKNNEDFNVKRMHRLMQIPDLYDPGFAGLAPNAYLETIRNFKPQPNGIAQINFERRQLIHHQLLYQLFDIPNPPQTFDEACERAVELNNVDFIL